MADGKARRREPPRPPDSGSSSGSDGEFERFLLRTKKPRSATCCTPRTPKQCLKDSEDNFLQYLKRKYESGKKASQQSGGGEHSTGSPPSALLYWDSDDDSVFTSGPLSDPCRPRPGASGQQLKCCPVLPRESSAHKPCSDPSQSETREHSAKARSRSTAWRARPGKSSGSGSDSSDEEIGSLIMRVKQRMCLSSDQSAATPKNMAEQGRAGSSLESLHVAKENKSAFLTPAPLSKTEALSEDGSLFCQVPRRSSCQVQGCFLQELSDAKSQQSKYFRRKKEELAQKLYAFYNLTVFEQKLPERMEIVWNKKMRKTAGCCITGQLEDRVGQRYARIMLSEKVCDSAERLRDTLIHELCHAAVWLIHGVHDGHGRFWSLYAKRSTAIHPELPVVSRCHNYEINYKFIYECSRCKNTIGRHSKSLDTERFVCALCKGPLVLCQPRQKDGIPAKAPLTPFAKYVKDHYGTVKRSQKDLSHGEVMKKLSAEFAAQSLGH